MLREMFGQYAATGGAYSSKVRCCVACFAPSPNGPPTRASRMCCFQLGKLWTMLLSQLDLDATVCFVAWHACWAASLSPVASAHRVALARVQVMVKKAKRSMDSASALAKTVVRGATAPACTHSQVQAYPRSCAVSAGHLRRHIVVAAIDVCVVK